MDNQEQIKTIIRNALSEDIGDGDLTTLATVPAGRIFGGRFIAKAHGIIAGLDVVKMVFALVDESIEFTPFIQDGYLVHDDMLIGTAKGSGQALLQAERTALNFLQRMSGIASLTYAFVQSVKGTKAVILDTRKTAPNLRLFDKWAVRVGGGQNHRIGLHDMALIKENHITAAGGISPAVNQVRNYDKHNRHIEVEVKNMTELEEALTLNVDRIMLDNMTPDEMRQAVQLTNGRTPLEASGNVNLENVSDIAGCGVDFISIGKLTHSVKALDISFCLD